MFSLKAEEASRFMASWPDYPAASFCQFGINKCALSSEAATWIGGL